MDQTDREMERRKFVQAALRREVSMAEVCQRFKISRKTGYKMLARHAELGQAGLKDGSRAPKVHPNQTSPEVEAAVLRVRKAHPTWGSKKILWTLDGERPDEDWPARSTVEEILKRAGLVEPRDRRLRRQPSSPPKVEACSRASLVCQAMVRPKMADVRLKHESTFLAFGLPRFMLSDGGPPFGANGLGRQSRLGVWLVRLGVIPVLTEPERPDQNGRHERFHETLKAETASPPRGSIRAQQEAFDGFQQGYNEERPHEALGMRPPAVVCELSPRQCPESCKSTATRGGSSRVACGPDGSIKWDGEMVFVGEAFAGEVVGIKPFDDWL